MAGHIKVEVDKSDEYTPVATHDDNLGQNNGLIATKEELADTNIRLQTKQLEEALVNILYPVTNVSFKEQVVNMESREKLIDERSSFLEKGAYTGGITTNEGNCDPPLTDVYMPAQCSGNHVYKTPLSNAEKCKNYRKRKKDANMVNKVSIKKTNAENCRMYRLRKKLLAQGHQSSKYQVLFAPSTSDSQMAFGSSTLPIAAEGVIPKNSLPNNMEVNETKFITINNHNKNIPSSFFKNDVYNTVKETDSINLVIKSEYDATQEACNMPIENVSTNDLTNWRPKEIPLNQSTIKIENQEIVSDNNYVNALKQEFDQTEANNQPYTLKDLNAPDDKTTVSDDKANDASTDTEGDSVTDEHNYKIDIDENPLVVNEIDDGDKNAPLTSDMDNENVFICKVCMCKCVNKRHLTTHLRTHTGQRVYTCRYCQNIYSSRSSLSMHLKTHTGEKPYCCALCPYRFAQRYSLKKHMWTHSDEKPYSCELCDYKCIQKNHFLKHMSGHSGEKPFSCPNCYYKCSTRADLETHMRTHASDVFPCALCAYKGVTNSALVKHMRVHKGVHFPSTSTDDVPPPKSCTSKNSNIQEVPNKKADCTNHTSVDHRNVCIEIEETKIQDMRNVSKSNIVPDKIECTSTNKFLESSTNVTVNSIELDKNNANVSENCLLAMQDQIVPKREDITEAEICSKEIDRRTIASGNSNDELASQEDNSKISEKGPIIRSVANKNSKRNKTTKKDKYACGHCQYKFNNYNDLKIHMKSHIKSDYTKTCYTCKKCHQVYNSNESLTAHMKTSHEEKLYYCHLCDYKCMISTTFVQHMRTHTGDKPYSCEFCDYKCVQKFQLLRHVKTHSDDKPYACQFCKYKCRDKYTLKYHIRTHTGEKPYTCEICNHKTSHGSAMSQHMKRNHASEETFACKHCQDIFYTKSSFATHLKTHDGKKRYPCKICRKKFTRTSLPTHMKTHTGEKPFTCNYCPYKSAKRGTLTEHIRTHTGEKPFSCEHCQCKFTYKSTLKRHIKAHTDEKSMAV